MHEYRISDDDSHGNPSFQVTKLERNPSIVLLIIWFLIDWCECVIK